MRINSINREIKNLRKLNYNINRRLQKLPEERVYIRKNRNAHALRIRSGGSAANTPLVDKYLSLNNPEASDFVTKLYLEKVNEKINKKLETLEGFKEKYDFSEPEIVIEEFPRDIIPLIKSPLLTKEQRVLAWLNEPYDSNPMDFDPKTNYSVNNKRFRSRAEMIISNILFMADIPYRYEAAFILDGRIVYPDFTIMNPDTGELFYLEYFGLMNDPDYAIKQFKKIQEYSKTGEAANFIYIFEYGDTVSMDTKAMENYILRNVFRNQPALLQEHSQKLN